MSIPNSSGPRPGEVRLWGVAVKAADVVAIRSRPFRCPKVTAKGTLHGAAFKRLLGQYGNRVGLNWSVLPGRGIVLTRREDARDEFAGDLTLAGVPHRCIDEPLYAQEWEVEGLEP